MTDLQVQNRIAVVQDAPVLLDREATVERAIEKIDEAADGGAKLVAFPEAFIPGYPTWIWRLRPGGDMTLLSELHGALVAQSVTMGGAAMDAIREHAKQRGVVVGMGINELDEDGGRSTLFNTYVIIGDDGEVLLRHRKLLPTNPERTVWGRGDGSGLKVVDTPVGRVGVLICWESYMPLARAALYAQGLDLYLAPTWDSGERWLATLRHIAAESGAWVVGITTAMRARDVPAEMPGRDTLFPDEDEHINSGDSAVFAPFSGPVAGPLHQKKGILYADIDLGKVVRARRSLDVAGHYSRPDVLELRVDRTPRRSVTFVDEEKDS